MTVYRGSKLTIKARSLSAVTGTYILYGDQQLAAKVTNQREIEVSLDVLEGEEIGDLVLSPKGKRLIEANQRRLTIKALRPPNAEIITLHGSRTGKRRCQSVEFSGRDDFEHHA